MQIGKNRAPGQHRHGARRCAECVKASSICHAVVGGEEGRVLRDLQNYEQTLTVHRKLKPDDLETLGKMSVPEARIVPVSWMI